MWWGTEGTSQVELIIEHTDSLADEGSSKIRTIYFAGFFPYAALSIGKVKSGSTNISTNSVRFSTNDLGLIENNAHEGSQVNAYRHALWQATITHRFGTTVAEGAGNAHEENPNAIFGVEDFSATTYGTSSLADESCDLLNNIIGRGLGQRYTDTTTKMNQIAIDTLNYHHEYGLWVSEERDGNYTIFQQKISDSQYETAYDRLNQLDKNGYAQNQK